MDPRGRRDAVRRAHSTAGRLFRHAAQLLERSALVAAGDQGRGSAQTQGHGDGLPQVGRDQGQKIHFAGRSDPAQEREQAKLYRHAAAGADAVPHGNRLPDGRRRHPELAVGAGARPGAAEAQRRLPRQIRASFRFDREKVLGGAGGQRQGHLQQFARRRGLLLRLVACHVAVHQGAAHLLESAAVHGGALEEFFSEGLPVGRGFPRAADRHLGPGHFAGCDRPLVGPDEH